MPIDLHIYGSVAADCPARYPVLNVEVEPAGIRRDVQHFPRQVQPRDHLRGKGDGIDFL